MTFLVKDTHREKELKWLQKVWIWICRQLVHWINNLWEVLTLGLNVQKKIMELLAKLRSLWKINFVLSILFVLTLVSDKVILIWNCCVWNCNIVDSLISGHHRGNDFFPLIGSGCHLKSLRVLNSKVILKTQFKIFKTSKKYFCTWRLCPACKIH